MQLPELLAQVDSLKAEIDQLRPLKPEVEHRIMQKFRLDWNYHSNAIEGNTLTLGETKALLMENLTAKGKPWKDHSDIKGHNELIDSVLSFNEANEQLTEAAIRAMHKILLREPYEMEAVTLDGRPVKKLINLGDYKKTPNFVKTSTGEIHQYSPPEDVGPAMAELISWLRKEEKEATLHPIVQAAFFHHSFLKIHPFDDGNGRLGRVLMNLLIMRAGFPPAIVKLSEREPYVAALRKADAGEHRDIVQFIIESVKHSLELNLRAAKGYPIEDADDTDKEVELLKRELQEIPIPSELNWETQQNHIETDLIPLLERIDRKLLQFDEFFAKPLLTVKYPKKRPQDNLVYGAFFEQPRNVFIQELKTLIHDRYLLTTCQYNYNFNSFLRDGPNDFSINVGFDIYYQERRLQFRCEKLSLSRDFVYGAWFSEDEQQSFVNGLAKCLLGQIKQNRKSGV